MQTLILHLRRRILNNTEFINSKVLKAKLPCYFDSVFEAYAELFEWQAVQM